LCFGGVKSAETILEARNMRTAVILQKRFWGALILFALAGAAISSAAYVLLEQDTLKSYLEKGAPFDFILVDVRSAEEASAGIGNAECKPYNLEWPEQFKSECAKIPKDRTVILYCRSGGRAGNAAAYMSSLGFAKVYSAGGMLTWNGSTVPRSEFKPASALPEPSMKAKTGK
jgi:rhodanese-related sulfurtransferase